MTFTTKLNVERVCRDMVTIALSLVEGDGPLSAKEKSDSTSRRRKKHRDVFYNQVTMRHGTKSIKVFNNGSMHVTGCTSPEQFVQIAREVCEFMRDVAGVADDVRVDDFNIQMINVNFSTGSALHLQGMKAVCIERGYAATYDPDVYPGLNIKVPVNTRHVTLLVFRSGRIIITGAKGVSDIVAAHTRMAEMLDTCPDVWYVKK